MSPLRSRLARAEAALGRQNNPLEIVITGGLPNASPYDVCCVSDQQIERDREESVAEFKARARQLAIAHGVGTIVFGGLPT